MSSTHDERLVRKVFSEIVAGYSLAKLSDEVIYIKHFSGIDSLEFDFRYQETLETAKRRGLPTEEEKLELLIRDGVWSKQQEEVITNLKENLNTLYVNKRQHYSPKDIAAFNADIKEHEETLFKLLNDKHNLMGDCAESFARRKIDLEQVFASFYKDSALTKQIFPKETTDDLDDREVNKLIAVYNSYQGALSDLNIRKVSVSGEFQTMFGLSENLYYFFGVPTSKLTTYQTRLATHGSNFKVILNSEVRPPNSIIHDPEALEDWYFARNNIQKVIDKNGENKNVSIVGMTRKELEYLGIQTDNPGTKSLAKALKEKGGELSKEEMISMGFL